MNLRPSAPRWCPTFSLQTKMSYASFLEPARTTLFIQESVSALEVEGFNSLQGSVLNLEVEGNLLSTLVLP